ncbi:MAG: lactate utilization protein B, partial [Chromatiales bacterium]
LWDARVRRDAVAATIAEWEQMRELASEIKKHTLSNLDSYLERFEENATRNGIHVHWARDAEEHNQIVYDIFKRHGVKTVTKGKSMLHEECGLREYLAERGIELDEADLGERIQQLDGERPSHIVMPAIHKLRKDVAELFAEKLGSDPHNDDPHYLNRVMRNDMRKRFVKADAGMSGVNFLIAETGGFVVCTNEGNADISANVPPLYVASAGIEKMIPGPEHLPLYIRLLSRSALGFAITQYTSHYHGPAAGQELHLVLVDNGRSERLASETWEVLKCIRCAACFNTCPVFRRSGGLSYEAVYAGPIGIVLEPSYDLHHYAQLPYSCTHCGSCGNVCPVKIPIPEYVFHWRKTVVEQKEDELSHRYEILLASKGLVKEGLFKIGEATAIEALKAMPHAVMASRFNPWAKAHEMPEAPKQTFRQWYKAQREA